MRPTEPGSPHGLFVGLSTLDVIQLVDHVPASNEKLTAREQTVAAGGPAANAAVTFGHLGGTAYLLTAIGSHPLGLGITADLNHLGVTVSDLAADVAEPPAVSSILVTASTGDRAVASTNATGHRLSAPDGLDALVAGRDVVEFDGHHMDLAMAVARAARTAGCTTVLDGGSWKDGTPALLPFIDVAVCSADFRPPGATTPADTLRFLGEHGVTWSAVSRGGQPIVWAGPEGGGSVDVPAVRVSDTLGAGDVLHGALAYYLAAQALASSETPARTRAQSAAEGRRLTSEGFVQALRAAAAVASQASESFGTRAWMLTDRTPDTSD